MAATRSRAKVRALSGSHSFERVAYTVPEFCFRNGISRPTYHRLRAQGRGPKEMRLGLNKILITADAERDWHELMQGPRPDLESRNAERAVMAGSAHLWIAFRRLLTCALLLTAAAPAIGCRPDDRILVHSADRGRQNRERS